MGLFSGVANSFSGGVSGSKGRQATNETTKQWSDKVQKEVENKFLEGLAGLDYASESELASLIADKAKDYNIDVEPIIAEARRQAEMESGQLYQSLARQAGSDANSLVAAAANEAFLDRESGLASLRAQLEAQNQAGGLDALATAIDAGNAATSTVLNLGNLLKGAQATTNSVTKANQLNWNMGYNQQRYGGFNFGQ
ncbi:MAG: hypothetical protein J6X75_05090 [Clostridia bacterium]|nr:hypothetical protein [Clostridia bacterium]